MKMPIYERLAEKRLDLLLKCYIDIILRYLYDRNAQNSVCWIKRKGADDVCNQPRQRGIICIGFQFFREMMTQLLFHIIVPCCCVVAAPGLLILSRCLKWDIN